MADVILFTQPDAKMGPAETSLCQVNGMTEIVITTGSTEERHQKGRGATYSQKPSEKTEILLHRNGLPVLNLASVPGAVAAAVVDYAAGRIFWFDRGECVEVQPCSSTGAARATIQARCRPEGGYEL